jgi:hypothetical protein
MCDFVKWIHLLQDSIKKSLDLGMRQHILGLHKRGRNSWEAKKISVTEERCCPRTNYCKHNWLWKCNYFLQLSNKQFVLKFYVMKNFIGFRTQFWFQYSSIKTHHILVTNMNACIELTNKNKKQTPWSESASELYRPSDRRFSAK